MTKAAPAVEKRLTPETISDMRRNMTDSAAAMALDHRARSIEDCNTKNFAELGIVCREVDERELWRFITKTDGDLCHSWDDWIQDALPVSRAQAYSARKVAQRLAHLSLEDRAAIGPGNLKTLAEVDDPKITKNSLILDAAKSMKPAPFRKKIATEYPEQHIEEYEPLRFDALLATDRVLVEEALVMAMLPVEQGGDGATSKTEALKSIAAFYIQCRPQAEITTEEELLHKPEVIH